MNKINDEFIVDCTPNSREERQLVYKFLVDNRGYESFYLTLVRDYTIIVCRRHGGNSNFDDIEDAVCAFPTYPVLTFEEFKQKYLNINSTNMTIKNLIGYRLTKPEYNEAAVRITGMINTSYKGFIKDHLLTEKGILKPQYGVEEQYPEYLENIKKAGVLDLWFEAVYEEFSVGDLVYSLHNSRDYTKDHIYKIKEITKIAHINCIICENIHDNSPKDIQHFRKPTAQEIKNYDKIKVGSYEFVFFGQTVEINAVRYTASEIEDLIDLMKKGQIRSLNVGCNGQYIIDLPLLERIYAKFYESETN